MKTTPRKILRSYRLDSEVFKELVRSSKALGISRTRLIEDALRLHFSGGLSKFLSEKAEALKSHKAA